jgi:hypothetical protein
MRQKFLLLLGILAVTCWVGVAAADIVTFDLTAPNTGINGFTGPFTQVEVDRTSTTTATITFTSLTAAGNIYLMGDNHVVDVNVNATSWTLGTITGTNSGTGFTPGAFSNGGSGNVDSFGNFNQIIDDFDGFTHSADSISFQLTDTSGTWPSASAVLTPNSDGWEAAAHIFVTASPANASNGAVQTGFAAGVVPIPPTALLLGSGLLGLVGLRRFRKS